MKSLKYEHTHEEWEAEGTKRISKKKKNLHKPKSNPTHKKTHLFSILFSVHGEVNAFKWNLILVSPILCHGCCFFYFEWKNKIVKLALLVIAKKREHKNSKTAEEERERESWLPFAVKTWLDTQYGTNQQSPRIYVAFWHRYEKRMNMLQQQRRHRSIERDMFSFVFFFNFVAVACLLCFMFFFAE